MNQSKGVKGDNDSWYGIYICVGGGEICYENTCTCLLTGGVAIGEHLTRGRSLQLAYSKWLVVRQEPNE